MDEGSEHHTEGSDKNYPKEKEMQDKVVVWGSFTKLRKEEKWKEREKGKDTSNWMQSSREY